MTGCGGTGDRAEPPLSLAAVLPSVGVRICGRGPANRTNLEGPCPLLRQTALPEVRGDPSILRLVVTNSLDNAVMYTRTRDRAAIEAGCTDRGPETVFFVRDNGVGFDVQYVDKLFGVFSTLFNACTARSSLKASV